MFLGIMAKNMFAVRGGLHMDIVDKMVQYMETRDNSILLTTGIQMTIADLSVVIIEVLSWLRLEHKRKVWISQGRKTKHKPLEIDLKYPWCANLKMILEKEEDFGNLFAIKDGKFDFLDSISEEERMVAWEKAYNGFNDPIHMLK